MFYLKKIIIKSIIKIQIILFIPIGVFIVLFIRLIRPWILVRIGMLVSQRIGHYAGNMELYCCEIEAGINAVQQKHIDLWYNNWPICNKQLARMWARSINIFPTWLLAPADRINSWIPGGDIHKIRDATCEDRDINNLLDLYDPHISFTPEEEELGKLGLEALGLPRDASFVCLLVRDDSYLKKTLPWKDWSYHDYRNCDIQNYSLAAEELSKLGYYVIRMGVYVNEAMNIQDKKIIDYASNGQRSDFMDIYLGANCSFCVSNSSGFDAVPYIFRRPIVFIDLVPIGFITTFSNKFLITTKLIRLCTEDRLMTFREMYDSGLGDFGGINERMSVVNDIELIESSPEEITLAVLEMESRIKGNWTTTPEDDELQNSFWEIFPKTAKHGEIRSFIGRDFLRQNRDLINN